MPARKETIAQVLQCLHWESNHHNLLHFTDAVWNTTMQWLAGEFMCRLCQMMKQFGMYSSSFMVAVSWVLLFQFVSGKLKLFTLLSSCDCSCHAVRLSEIKSGLGHVLHNMRLQSFANYRDTQVTVRGDYRSVHQCRTRFLLCCGVGGGGARCKRIPKVLICSRSGQNPSKSGQKWPPMLFYLKKWRPTFAKKHMNNFFGGYTKKGLYDLCGRKYVGKSHTNTFRASLGKFRQKSFAPQKICLFFCRLCSYKSVLRAVTSNHYEKQQGRQASIFSSRLSI